MTFQWKRTVGAMTMVAFHLLGHWGFSYIINTVLCYIFFSLTSLIFGAAIV